MRELDLSDGLSRMKRMKFSVLTAKHYGESDCLMQRRQQKNAVDFEQTEEGWIAETGDWNFYRKFLQKKSIRSMMDFFCA